MLTRSFCILLMLTVSANIALAGGLALGGYYVFGYPVGTLDITEETTDTGNRIYNIDSGIKLGYGATNFGLGFKYQLFDLIGIGVEGSAEYHMGYKNEACTSTGTTEYEGQTNPYTLELEADQLELQTILINVGAYYSPRQIGMLRPFFGGGFTYSLNTLFELDDMKYRTDVFDKGNCPGIYGQAGIELSTAYNYSVFVPLKYSYYFESSFVKEGVDESSFEPGKTPSEYRMKLSPMLYFGIGIYYIPF